MFHLAAPTSVLPCVKCDAEIFSALRPHPTSEQVTFLAYRMVHKCPCGYDHAVPAVSSIGSLAFRLCGRGQSCYTERVLMLPELSWLTMLNLYNVQAAGCGKVSTADAGLCSTAQAPMKKSGTRRDALLALIEPHLVKAFATRLVVCVSRPWLPCMKPRTILCVQSTRAQPEPAVPARVLRAFARMVHLFLWLAMSAVQRMMGDVAHPTVLGRLGYRARDAALQASVLAVWAAHEVPRRYQAMQRAEARRAAMIPDDDLELATLLRVPTQSDPGVGPVPHFFRSERSRGSPLTQPLTGGLDMGPDSADSADAAPYAPPVMMPADHGAPVIPTPTPATRPVEHALPGFACIPLYAILTPSAGSGHDPAPPTPLAAAPAPETPSEPAPSHDVFRPAPGLTPAGEAAAEVLRLDTAFPANSLHALRATEDEAAGAGDLGRIVQPATGVHGGVTITGPVVYVPTLHRNTLENVLEGKRERIDKKHVPFKPTPRIFESLKRWKDLNKDIIFTEEKIRQVCASIGDLHDIRSSKWTYERLDQVYLFLCERSLTGRYPTLGVMVKQEAYKPGKAPRLVINDGDAMQVCALVCIYVFEHILFEYYSNHIKHVGKVEAMNKVVSKFRHASSRVAAQRQQFSIAGLEPIVEEFLGFGDGSAWDTCCSKGLRETIEDPILKRITSVTVPFFLTPPGAAEQHLDVNTRDQLNLAFGKAVGKSQNVVIANIRRSGHRGTSCLNFYVNHALWHVCFFPIDQLRAVILNPEAMHTDRFGFLTSFLLFCEGDDSLWHRYSVFLGELQNAAQAREARTAQIDQFWKMVGFNMVWTESAACSGTPVEFCGWVFSNGEEFGEHAAPALLRALDKVGISASAAVAQAWRLGDFAEARRLSADKYAAYAENFAASFPTVSRWFVQWCRLYASGTTDGSVPIVVSREVSMAQRGDDSLKGPQLGYLEDIEARIAFGTDEVAACAALGFPTTHLEFHSMFSAPPTFDLPAVTGSGEGALAHLLPVAWRRA